MSEEPVDPVGRLVGQAGAVALPPDLEPVSQLHLQHKQLIYRDIRGEVTFYRLLCSSLRL